MENKIRELLKKGRIILDGAMGTMLQSSGLKVGELPELLNLSNPDKITAIHKAYVDAGADLVYANTFGANRYKLGAERVAEVVSAGIVCAKKSGAACVALDIGPTGKLMQPLGSYDFEEIYECYLEICQAGAKAGADCIVLETQTDLKELKAGILAARETGLPILCSMSFEEGGRTFTGTSPETMAITLEGLGVEAIGVNCSLGPKALKDILLRMADVLPYDFPLMAKPNAGLPDPITNLYDLSAEGFGVEMQELYVNNVKILGGCCGTTPQYIKELCKALDQPCEIQIKEPTYTGLKLCSGSKFVEVTGPTVIGERINPTGKKRLQAELKAHNLDYIKSQALEQIGAGAQLLDVNVGVPGIDEVTLMDEAVMALQSVTDVPLVLDSTNPKVLEKALRHYVGKPLVNSVNGEEKSLESVLPLVKKYGACVIGLTLDDKGIPQTADARLEIAKKILSRAEEAGIPKNNLCIDCLTMTVSAEPNAAKITLDAVKKVHDELQLNVALGVSNVSFGLPQRPLLNQNFLTLAMGVGLTLPIMNPNLEGMMASVRSYRVLKAMDENAFDYINAYGAKAEEAPKPAAAPVETELSLPSLRKSVELGLSSDVKNKTEQLIDTTDPMQIVDEVLIPALDTVGDAFAKGTLYLPQLMLAAEAAQTAFQVIRDRFPSNSVNKGEVILATVEGDIHDIGKNIVKVLLENYGFKVYDLGKNVPPAEVLRTAKEQNVRLVGLSALMTTTLDAMRKTTELLHEWDKDCKVMVGGAVLTQEFADRIGANFYSKTAKESADYAKKHYGIED